MMFRRMAALLLLFIALPLIISAQEGRKRERSGLFPIEQNYKWGYMNASGKIVIPPQFDAADYFYEGLARVTVDKKKREGIGKGGYIDKTGKWVIKPQFDLASEFSEGLAAVGMRIGDGY